jgi:hypothetical protein
MNLRRNDFARRLRLDAMAGHASGGRKWGAPE